MCYVSTVSDIYRIFLVAGEPIVLLNPSQHEIFSDKASDVRVCLKH